MKRTFAYLLALALLLTAMLPVNAAALEPDWNTAGMKKESILLQPQPETAETPAAEPPQETIPEETAEYTAPSLSIGASARAGGSMSGTCGENIHWVLNGTVLTISGTGVVKKEHFDEIWKAAGGIATEVVVEPGITDIWDDVFRNRQGITKVTLADTVEYLGSSCFSGCSNLSEVKLSSALTGIPQACFMETNISEITIPEGVKYLNGSAFSQCPSLESVVIPDTVTRIGDFCFTGCEKLKTVRLSCNIKVLPDLVFSGTGLESLEIPNSVQSLGSNPFSYCPNLKKLVIPPGVGYLGDSGITDYGDLVIYGWENTAAHIYAMQNGISFELMPEPAEGDLHNISLQSNQLGTASVSTLRTTTGSTVVVEAIPNSDTVMGFVEVYYFSEEEIDLHLEQLDDMRVTFKMPPLRSFGEGSFLGPE